MSLPPVEAEAEAARLDELRRYGQLDTSPETEFDDLARLAAHMCNTPIALIGLVDETRVWFRGRFGIALVEVAREGALSAATMEAGVPLVVPDLREDSRFGAHPMVTGAGMRFYAGVPLRSPAGHLLGVVCVMDTAARDGLGDGQRDALETIARHASALLEARRAAVERDTQLAEASGLNARMADFGSIVMDSATNAFGALDLEGRVIYFNRRGAELTGFSEQEMMGMPFTHLLGVDALALYEDVVSRVLTAGEMIRDVETEIRRKDGSTRLVSVSLGPLRQDGEIIGIAGAAEDITDRKHTNSLLAWQRRMLEMIAVGSPLDEMMSAVATWVEQQTAAFCAVFVTSDDETTLQPVAAPSLPSGFVAALDGLRIGPDAPSCGAAVYRRAPVITHDAWTDPLWEDYRDVMARFGLRSAWSTPIITGNSNLYGVLDVYSASPRLPGERDMQIIDMATHLAALAIGRTRFRERVAESELRYRLLFETSTDAIVLVDEDDRIRFANPAVADVFGYQPYELVDSELAVLQPVELRGPHLAGRERYLGAGVHRPAGRATRAVGLHRDGRQFPIEITFSDMEAGGRTAFACFIRDVTEQSRVDEALRRSAERYRALAENALDLVCELDDGGAFTYVSPNFEQILGHRPADLLGKVAFTIIHPDDAPEVGAEFASNIESPVGGNISFRVARGDGSWCWIESSANFFTSGDGSVHAVVVSRDITERQQMEASLRDSEERLRSFVRNAPMTLYALDRDGTFTLYEGANIRRAGLDPDAYLGRSIFDVHRDHEQVLVNTRRCLAGEAFVDIVPVREGTYEVHHTPLFDEAGAVSGMIGVLIDITQRRRAESLLQTQRELLEMIAVGAPLDRVLERLTQQFEEHVGGGLCSIHLVTEDGASLQSGAAPSLPDSFNDATGLIPIGEGVGSCGTAAFRREAVIVTDIAADALWKDFAEAALEHDLRACWSVPIFSMAGSVLGTFAIYYREPREPDARDRDIIDMASRVAAIAIERQRAEEAGASHTLALEEMYGRLKRANEELEESKHHLEEKSILLERALETERDRARRDPLTGLLNHAAITGMLRDFIAGSSVKTLALAMVDVDGLKAANDTYGHQVGDALLVLVSEKLERRGAIVGRYGGDEFVAILPGADRKAAEEYREDVLGALATAGLVDEETGADVPVVASMGLAIYPEEAAAVDDLIRLSDSAMYASRRQRPAGEPGRTLTRALGGDRAAKMVGEIVPLLTSSGNIDDKLRLVSHRLSVGAGYDGVHFIIDRQRSTTRAEMSSSAFARVPDEQLREWNEYQANNPNRVIQRILYRTRRPIIIDDIASTELMPEDNRTGLVSVGLQSCLIAPMMWEDELIGALSVASKRHAAFSVRDAEFVGAVATQVTAIVQMSRLLERLQTSSSYLREAHESTVLMLASAAEAHDRTTGRHLERVRRITEALADELGYDAGRARELGLAATLHDIGKIRVPDTVLGSSQSLADAEWVLMKQHTLWGSAFLDGKPGFELAAMVARCHHERWDGQGYPDGLAGDDIPEAAQITTVADSFDAMTSDRPYRSGRPISEAVAEIVSCAGTQFSPRIVEALVRLVQRGDLGFLHHEDEDGTVREAA